MAISWKIVVTATCHLCHWDLDIVSEKNGPLDYKIEGFLNLAREQGWLIDDGKFLCPACAVLYKK